MALITKNISIDKINVFAFDHIYKCAGSTVYNILSQSPSKSYFIPTACSSARIYKTISDHKPGDIIFLFGHATWGIHYLLPNNFKVLYFTLIRHPINLAISSYHYGVNAYEIQRLGLNQYLEEFNFRTMVSHLGEATQKAHDRLNQYALVGFVEEFNEAMASIANLTNIPLPQSQKQNVSPAKILPDHDLVTYLIDKGGPDFDLYFTCGGKHIPSFPKKSPQNIINANSVYTPTDNAFRASLNSEKWINTKKLTLESKEDIYHSFFHKTRALAQIYNIALEDKFLIDAIDLLEDLSVNCIVPRMVKSESVFSKICKIADFLENNLPKDGTTVMSRRLQEVLTFIANSTFAEEHGLSENYHQKSIAVYDEYPQPIYAYCVWLRKNKRFHDALSSLKKIKEAYKDKLFFIEYAVTLYLAHGEKALYDSISSHQETAEKYFNQNFFPTLGNKIKKLNSFIGNNVLMIRSGPEIIFRDLIRAIRNTVESMAMIVQDDFQVGDGIPEESVFRISSGKFDPNVMFKREQELRGKAYDALIFVIANYSHIDSLSNFFSFTNQLKCKEQYFYTMDNIFLKPEKKFCISDNI